MYILTNKPDMGARFYSTLFDIASNKERGVDSMHMIQLMAGVLVETYMIFENPDEAMEGSLAQMSRMLSCEPLSGALAKDALPPAHIIDRETERGRAVARDLFQEWLDCEFEFHQFILEIFHDLLLSWEPEGQSRGESFRLLCECVKRCMAFEIAAQELCDVVIESKVAEEGWSLGDCVASLSAIAGHRLATSLSNDSCFLFRSGDLPENLDRVVYVMTQEAVRLGVPAGSDWRFGLAANDMPVNAPLQLISGIEPVCLGFFDVIGVDNTFDQAVCCAKAAGRMLAVAAGGSVPEIEPAIAKPLAMAAMTESYKFVCMEQAIVSC